MHVQVDPRMERTVLVSTKFDSRLAQFATGADAESFLHPTKEQLSGGSCAVLGGAPFFTSVPSGRVGNEDSCKYQEYDPFRLYVLHMPCKQSACAFHAWDSALSGKLTGALCVC